MAVLFNDGVRAGASGAGDTGYQIAKSLRFNSGDSAYLNRTPSSVWSDRRKWTWSGWVKRGALASTNNIFSMDGEKFLFQFTSSDRLEIYDYVSGYNFHLYTDDVYRDPSA